jgi:fumarylacetoacetate (FAA) hydrolase
MKLATLNDGTRDGQLMVVSRDLKTAQLADGVCRTLQRALDDWTFIAPQLDAIYQELNRGGGRRSFDFEPANCMAPLPRLPVGDGSAYVNHVELVRKARGAEMPASFWEDPLMYQGGSDDFLGPPTTSCWRMKSGASISKQKWRDHRRCAHGRHARPGHQRIRLLMLANDVSLRNLIPEELAKGFGFVQSKPATSFSPVAVTPDELGDAWKGGKVHLPLLSTWNGKLVGKPHAGVDMVFNFPQLIAHLAKTRNVRAGSIIGSGTVSNKDPKRGYSCIAEQRCLEMIAGGEPVTPFMAFGDTIRIEMLDDGKSVFGAINQTVKQA